MSLEESSDILHVRKHNNKQAPLQAIVLSESFDAVEIE